MSRYHANELLNNRKNDIQHWKYVKKIPIGKSYRYFYSWDEYKAFLADPAAELEKAGNMAKREIKSAGRNVSAQIKKTEKKTRKEIQSRGKKAVERLSSRQTKGNVAMGVVKAKNKSRPESFKQRLDKLAKKASEKWKEGKEKVKEIIDKGSRFSDKNTNDKKVKNKTIKKDPHGYKYVEKIKVNGKTYYFYSNQEYQNYLKNQERFKNEPEFMKQFKHSDVPYTRFEDAILVNPEIYKDENRSYLFGDKYEYNCAECSAVYELRRRGYDVEANGVSGWIDEDANIVKQGMQLAGAMIYNTDDRFFMLYKDPKIQYVSPTTNDSDTAKGIYEEITKNPPGSRGEISVAWKGGSGHSMVWEYDENKKVHIIDTQISGQSTCVEYDLRELSSQIDNSSIEKNGAIINDGSINKNKIKPNQTMTRIVRTDNLELNVGVKYIIKDCSEDKQGYAGFDYDASNNEYKKSSKKNKHVYYPTLSENKRRSEFEEYDQALKEGWFDEDY